MEKEMMEDKEFSFDEGTRSRLDKFLRDFDERNKSDVQRMRKDRAFACGDQWNEFVTAAGESGRPEAVFNMIDNFKNAIVNPFLARPFDISYTMESTAENSVDAINEWVRGLQNEWQTKNAIETGLIASVECGRGFFYVTNTDDNRIGVFAVDDPTMVMFDPNSTEINGSDAETCAVVEYITKSKAKAKYGEKYDEDVRKDFLPNLGENFNPQEDMSIIINFYELKTEYQEVQTEIGTQKVEVKAVLFTKFLDGNVVQQVSLPLKHIPVVPICGTKTWIDKHRTFVGITHKLRYPQMVINYAVRQLMERLARTPKSQLIIGKTALQGNERYYENADKNLSPLLPYNDFSSGGQKIDPPVRFDNSVQCDDIISIVQGQMDLMASIVGMPLSGVASSLGAEETAESILLRTKSTESNVSHFTEHAKQSVKQLGVVLLEFYTMYHPEIAKGLRVVVGAGPEAITSKMEARRQLLALSQLYPEDMKPVIAYGITKTLDNIEISSVSNMLAKLLPPEVLSDEIPQVAQLQMQIQQILQANQQQMAQKDATIKDLQNQLLQLQLKTESDYQIAAMNNASKEKIAAMQLMGKQQETAQKGELDAQKMYLDASMEQQKMASEIETKQKLADIEITKKLAELDVEKQKSQMDMQKKVMEIATRQEKPTQGV
jgi:hypothetical protein